MSFKVRRTEKAKEQMDSWNLPRELRLQVYARLFLDLPTNPDGLLGEQIVPLLARTYEFSLEAAGPIPYRIHFTFAIDEHDDVGELHVLGARMTTEATGEN